MGWASLLQNKDSSSQFEGRGRGKLEKWGGRSARFSRMWGEREREKAVATCSSVSSVEQGTNSFISGGVCSSPRVMPPRTFEKCHLWNWVPGILHPLDPFVKNRWVSGLYHHPVFKVRKRNFNARLGRILPLSSWKCCHQSTGKRTFHSLSIFLTPLLPSIKGTKQVAESSLPTEQEMPIGMELLEIGKESDMVSWNLCETLSREAWLSSSFSSPRSLQG